MYLDRIVLFDEFSLDAAMQQLNWSGVNMAEHADDFYRSLGLPPMTADFWANSIFARDDGFRNCHGTAANMFDGNDYRCNLTHDDLLAARSECYSFHLFAE